MIANDKLVSTRIAADVMVASFLTCKFACRSLAGRHRWDIRHRRRRTHHASLLRPRARRSRGMAAADERVPSLSQDFRFWRVYVFASPDRRTALLCPTDGRLEPVAYCLLSYPSHVNRKIMGISFAAKLRH